MLLPGDVEPHALPADVYRTVVESLADAFCLLEPVSAAAGAPDDYRYVLANAALEEHLGIAGLRGRTVRDVGGIEPDLIGVLDRVLRTGHPQRFDVRFPRLNFWLEAHAFVLDGGGVSGVGVLFSNVTARKERERSLQARANHVSAVAEAGPDLLWRSSRDGRDVWYNQRWYDYTGQTAKAASRFGWLVAIHAQDRMNAYNGCLSALARPALRVTREARLCSATGEHRWFLLRFAALDDGAGGKREWLCAATDIHDQRVAVLDAERRASALRRRLVAAEEEERRRFARELHDEAGQHLTALSLGLQNLTNALPPDARLDALAAELRRLTDVLSRELHSFALRLRPKALDDFGLGPAVTAYVQEWAQRAGVVADVHAQLSELPLPQPIAGAIYRIVQEALTNVARHSNARRVAVVIAENDGQVYAIVEDDGRGFDAERLLDGSAAGHGLGLIGVRERAELLGGSVEIETAPGRGTTLYVRFPRVLDME